MLRLPPAMPSSFSSPTPTASRFANGSMLAPSPTIPTAANLYSLLRYLVRGSESCIGNRLFPACIEAGLCKILDMTFREHLFHELG
jgi:hypothetical protein